MSNQQIIAAAPDYCDSDHCLNKPKFAIADGENVRYLCEPCAGAALLKFVANNYTLLTTCPTMESDAIQVIDVE